MRDVQKVAGLSLLIVLLSFLVGFLLGIDAGGLLPLALYLTGLLLGSLFVAFVAFRLGVGPRELTKTALIAVPVVLAAVLALIRFAASFVEAPASGPTEGDGFMIVLLFLLLPAVLLGLLGSLFELSLWRRNGNLSA
ncbi:hypothetical protein [Thermococcus nautili]|uniref:Uncharacterized protein n=2 Tax=Thermococcus nautili TaxID=195522 RepID=W8NXA5_9EURY|nr:hypothetical protein [Thermococcus nautili]AHL23822.1 hypothetical protein BD01_2234 [Thermococcus nautili]CAI1492100.1 conserved membrane protein of unknown function [Thermococcus nautili]